MISIIEFPNWSDAAQLLSRPSGDLSTYRSQVSAILQAVKTGGDAAARTFSKQFDGYEGPWKIPETDIAAAEQTLSPALKQAIRQAYHNIYQFHAAQKEPEIRVLTMPGVLCSRKSVPIEKVGLYIPGGTAPLFSTVLMLGVPAQIAGCHQVALCTPPDKMGHIHPAVLYAAQLCGIRDIYRIGGAQAIAAMAYGTETIPRVWKIFGPGNPWVTAAKQWVSLEGTAIDMPAGPSEVAVVADAGANPAFVAADLLSQAEHGTDSQVVLISDQRSVLEGVLAELDQQLARLPRKDLAMAALSQSRFLLVKDLEEAMRWINAYAPEHLILSVQDPEKWAEKVINAGSVFLGYLTPESAGDYASGTNHTLPTGGFARVYAGVSLDSFVKKITQQQITPEGLKKLGPTVIEMAKAEGLDAHAEAVRIRLEQLPPEAAAPASTGIQALLRPNIATLKPYSSARDEAPENDQGQTRIFLDANENSLGSPGSGDYHRYPTPRPEGLLQRLSALKNVPTSQIFVGNGSDEAIDLLIRAFCEPRRDYIITMPPTYGMYAVQARIQDVAILEAPLQPDFSPDLEKIRQLSGPNAKLLFICSPNNPSGNTISEQFILEVLKVFPGIVVIDEAYIDFSTHPSWLHRLEPYPRLVVLQTLSKAWGLAGLRLGMAFAHEELIEVLNKIKYPYNINVATAALGAEALLWEHQTAAMITRIQQEKERLTQALRTLPCVVRIFPSDANFVLVQMKNADQIYHQLAQAGVIVRNRSRELHCEGCLRITIGAPAENDTLIQILKNGQA